MQSQSETISSELIGVPLAETTENIEEQSAANEAPPVTDSIEDTSTIPETADGENGVQSKTTKKSS